MSIATLTSSHAASDGDDGEAEGMPRVALLIGQPFEPRPRQEPA